MRAGVTRTRIYSVFMKDEIRGRVDQVIKENNLSLSAIAKEAGLVYNTVAFQTSGARPYSLQVVAAIANLAPNVDVRWLLTGGERKDYSDTSGLYTRLVELEDAVRVLNEDMRKVKTVFNPKRKYTKTATNPQQQGK